MDCTDKSKEIGMATLECIEPVKMVYIRRKVLAVELILQNINERESVKGRK